MVVRWVEFARFDVGVKGGHADPSERLVFVYFGSEKAVADCTE